MNLDLVQGSALALDDAELVALGADGFVITDRHRYPHFAYGYQTIYSQDLPVFVTADAILQAVHQSYDAILEAIEEAALVPELDALLASMRTRLGTRRSTRRRAPTGRAASGPGSARRTSPGSRTSSGGSGRLSVVGRGGPRNEWWRGVTHVLGRDR